MTPDRPMRADARRNRVRILDAAEAVFTEKGAGASTEEVARLAGVGIGTVFRHFPTKEDLLRAIVTASVQRLAEQTQELLATGDPEAAFFTFFAGMVEQAAAKKTIVDLLGDAAGLSTDRPIHAWRDAIEALLVRAQREGAVREDVGAPEVLALLLGVCRAAVAAGWEPGLQEGVLRIVFDGLRT
ncbi:TetR family transcriptional regulator [Actinorhabdospora filicis]|uniref:TetR family transcriptional regulator n=1 Tax=Actinorhabdospora filicis TaxID=1785913 RepID=A0A9W6SG80_9ACTN|nr:TetR/AcrR family transcriptional regulator [Actinorhabdospora filicis]GLZ75433.1 TetR family transcriptional regulator [Actinorhabdospora filicis]